MSTALGIASVTAVLKDLLNNGVIDHDLASTVGSEVTVSALPPDRINVEPPGAQSQLNLFLYQVTPNQGWRNAGLPSQDSRGERLSNPPLALNLHYLLTAYGAGEFHAEILLGYGMQLLHENSVLPRAAIRRALTPSEESGVPPELSALSTSELAEQIELIKLTPEQMTTEEISKLWTAFGAKYRPSAAYHVSVLLIENHRPVRSPLPVRTRNLYVRAFRQPVIDEIRSQAAEGHPIIGNQPILPGYRLVLLGRQLRGDDTVIRIDNIEVIPAGEDLSDTQVIAALPANLAAGVHGAQVVHQVSMGTPPVPRLGIESNVFAFVLRPEITAPVAISNSQSAGDGTISADLEVTVNPAVGDRQRVVLLLNEILPAASPPLPFEQPRSYSFVRPVVPTASPPGPFDALIIPITGVQPGAYLVRVQVDGAQSLLTVDAEGRFDGPQVIIP
jgi:hypothetical protein